MKILSKALKKTINLIIPRQCLSCYDVIEEEGIFCPPCWAGLTFITDPVCYACGFPFPYVDENDQGTQALCGSCVQTLPAYGHLRSVVAYDGGIRELILRFKHGDAVYAAPGLARLMALALQKWPRKIDLIAPVPLHFSRLFKRRYNQAAVLATALSRETGIPVDNQLLERVKATVSQGGLSRKERAENVKHVFRVASGRAESIRGKTILLIDDVMTTGATVESCACALLGQDSVCDVDVLTVARVV